MENISTDTMLQIVVTVAAALALWLRLDSKIDGLRKELKGDIQRVDEKTANVSASVDNLRKELKVDIQRLDAKVDALSESTNTRFIASTERANRNHQELTERLSRFQLESTERLTRIEEKVECIIQGQPQLDE